MAIDVPPGEAWVWLLRWPASHLTSLPNQLLYTVVLLIIFISRGWVRKRAICNLHIWYLAHSYPVLRSFDNIRWWVLEDMEEPQSWSILVFPIEPLLCVLCGGSLWCRVTVRSPHNGSCGAEYWRASWQFLPLAHRGGICCIIPTNFLLLILSQRSVLTCSIIFRRMDWFIFSQLQALHPVSTISPHRLRDYCGRCGLLIKCATTLLLTSLIVQLTFFWGSMRFMVGTSVF